MNGKARKGKADKQSVKEKKKPSSSDAEKKSAEVVDDDMARENARMKEVVKAVRKLLKGDEDNLRKIGKHELMAFYDTRFKNEQDKDGFLMIVFGDTFSMGVKDTIMAMSCANAMLKDCVYGYTVIGAEASISRMDGKPVTKDDGKVIVKAYNEIMGKGAKVKDKKKRK